MQIINITDPSKIKEANVPLIIGGFDIIHKGHMELFNKTIPNNFSVLIIDNIPRKNRNFNSIDERIENVKNLFAKTIFIFDVQKNNIFSSEFIEQVLLKIAPNEIIIGLDFKFGKDLKLGRDILPYYFRVKLISEDEMYKTSVIANLYKNGKTTKARDSLCFPIYINGVVEQGNKIGRKIGFPTLNFKLDISKHYDYKPGVYAANVLIHNNLYKSALYIAKPVSNKQAFEAHIIDPFPFIDDKHNIGQNIKVDLLKYINSLKKNKSINELKKCVKTNVSLVKTFFAKEN